MTKTNNHFGVFKTASIGHSDTPPSSEFYPKSPPEGKTAGTGMPARRVYPYA